MEILNNHAQTPILRTINCFSPINTRLILNNLHRSQQRGEGGLLGGVVGVVPLMGDLLGGVVGVVPLIGR